MTFTIVACGESAKGWIPRGHSVGCNDAWKWGKPTDSLLVCNRPTNFDQERLRIITGSKPKDFYSHKGNWAYAFPQWKKIRLAEWTGLFNPKVDRLPLEERPCYHSNTVTFIALSLCYQLGATEIIMWGCDLVNHKLFNSDNPETEKEVKKHLALINCLNDQGVKVWLGANGTAFDEHLEVYKSIPEKCLEIFNEMQQIAKNAQKE